MTEGPQTAEYCSKCGAAATGGRFCANCGNDLSVATAGVPPAPIPRERGGDIVWAGLVVAIAGGLAILGSLLPWITATAPLVGTISRNGFDGGGDGIISAALGIFIVLFGIAMLARSGSPRTGRIAAALCALVLGWVAITDIGSVNERINSLNAGTAVASVGSGLILVAFAAVLTLVGAGVPSPKRAGP